MLDLSIILKSTKKSYTFPLNGTSLDSLVSNSSDMFFKQKWENSL